MLHRAAQLPQPASKAVAPRAFRAVRPVQFARLPVVKAAATEVEAKDAPVEDVYEGPDVNPSSQEVAAFVNTLCSETEIAEMHLKMGSFELKVKRSMGHAAAVAPPAPAAAPAAAHVAAASAAAASEAPATPSVEETVDESLVYVNAPKVGIFRRGKYSGGKRVGKGNAINVGEQVKKGQVLGYVEQLGTFVAFESPIAGELVKVHVEDGAPVEYGQLVVEIAPFFGGHIIGDSKYA